MDKPTARINFNDNPKPTRAVLLNYDETQFALENFRKRKTELLADIVESAEAHEFAEVERLSLYLAKLETLIKKLEG